MAKLYFVRTNGYDMIISDDGELRRVLTEMDCHDVDIDAGFENPEKRAMEILKTVEDDSSWEVEEKSIDDLINSEYDKILAEMEW